MSRSARARLPDRVLRSSGRRAGSRCARGRAGGGFYLGNWNSSIGFTNAGIEMDFYGGYKGEVSGVGYDVGVLQYYYPQKDKVIDFNVTEIYGALSYEFVSAKYSYTASKDYFG